MNLPTMSYEVWMYDEQKIGMTVAQVTVWDGLTIDFTFYEQRIIEGWR